MKLKFWQMKADYDLMQQPLDILASLKRMDRMIDEFTAEQQTQLTEDLELLLNDLAYYAIMAWKREGGPEATDDKSHAKLQVAIRDTLIQNVDLLKKYLSE